MEWIVFGLGIVNHQNGLEHIRIKETPKILIGEEVFEMPLYVLPCDRNQALNMVNAFFDKLDQVTKHDV